MKKKLFVVFLEVAIVFLFLISVNFLYQSKISKLAEENYRSQFKNINQLFVQTLGKAKNVKQETSGGEEVVLRQRLKTTAEFKKKLANSCREKQEQGEIFDKISVLNREDLKPQVIESQQEREEFFRQIEELREEIARSREENKKLKTEVNSLNEEKEEIVYEKLNLEAKMIEYVNTVNLLNQEMRELKNKVGKLGKERKELIAFTENLGREHALSYQEKDRLEEFLEQLNKKLQSKEKRISSLEEEFAVLKEDYSAINSQYIKAKEKVGDIEIELVGRANKMSNLERVLKEKNVLKLVDKLENQLKDLVNLREVIVKVRLENVRLAQELRSKKDFINSLNERFRRIRRSSRFPVKEFSVEGSGKEKEIKVEIESIHSE